MTFQEMYELVQDLVNDSSVKSLHYIKRTINYGQQDFLSRFDWPFLRTSATFATVNGTESYTLSATCRKVIDLRDITNENFVQEFDYRSLHEQVPSPSTTDDKGNPLYWYPTLIDSSGNQQIKLYPVPNGAYTIGYDFYKKISDLSVSSDVSVIPARFHQTLVDYACQRCWEKDQSKNSITMASYYGQRYEQTIAKALEELRFDTDNLPQVKPTTHHRQTVRDLRF